MRTRTKAALLALPAALVVAWPVASALEGHGPDRPLAYRNLTAQLGRVTFPRPAVHVFTRRVKLTGYLAAVMPGDEPVAPPIDFSRRKAVLVALGPRSSSGYFLRVVSASLRDGHARIVLREVAPGLHDRVVPGVTYPYLLITIPRTKRSTAAVIQGRP